ncbi:MAG: DUF389 domain-containing protein [Flavobacteriales bacterium]|nr:DUF389 domain-containing protein [Flavobacteriales bacterium]
MTFERLLAYFRLGENAEDPSAALASIERNVIFRGTNLLILIFAILIASVGLNVNSAAVIIGAMLISPLMGPIVGAGAGLGVMDLGLVRRSLNNFGFAVLASLATSTLYFLISPLSDAHSEILARTSPSTWDVLIAISGALPGSSPRPARSAGTWCPGWPSPLRSCPRCARQAMVWRTSTGPSSSAHCISSSSTPFSSAWRHSSRCDGWATP